MANTETKNDAPSTEGAFFIDEDYQAALGDPSLASLALDALLPVGDNDRLIAYNQKLTRFCRGERDPKLVAEIRLIEGLKDVAAQRYDHFVGHVALK